MYHVERFHAAPQVARALKADQFGWGHDGRGHFYLLGDGLQQRNVMARVWRWMKRRISMAHLEHVNVTVADPKATAQMLAELFGWRVRWQGEAISGGYTVHVGGDDSYVAVYTGPAGGKGQVAANNSYLQRGGLNHIGVVVDDLDAVEAAVKKRGYVPTSHADYEPGRRFYFHEENGVEIEVVSYA